LIISLDYDDTYTRNPEMWDRVIRELKDSGCTVYCVTLRYPDFEGEAVRAALHGKVDKIFCTGRQAKRDFMYSHGIHVHVWIDDNPNFIIMDAAS